MKSKSTIKRHIRELRRLINRPTSAETAPENILCKGIAYCVETVLRYEVENTAGWRTPINEVMAEAAILAVELKLNKNGN